MKAYERLLLQNASAKEKQLFELRLQLLTIKKDIVDTFKPYKTNEQIKRDLYKQPFYGIGNVLKAALHVVVIAGVAVYQLFAGAVQLVKSPIKTIKNIPAATAQLLALTASTLLIAIRGVLQIATWPLTILLRAPLRGLITLIKGRPLVEDNPGFKALTGQLDTVNPKSAQSIFLVTALLIKAAKADMRKQKTNHLNKTKMVANSPDQHGERTTENMTQQTATAIFQSSLLLHAKATLTADPALKTKAVAALEGSITEETGHALCASHAFFRKVSSDRKDELTIQSAQTRSARA